MARSIIACALACVLFAGCSKSPETKAGKSFVWERETRPYQILGVTESNVPRIGDQTRVVQAVFPIPRNRDEVETALDEIYAELKEDIEQTQPDAEYRSIVITIYDARGDVEHDGSAWLCRLAIAPEAGEALPNRASEAVAWWQWRDPDSRPTERDRRIEWEYLEGLQQINRSVAFPVTEAELPGKTAGEKRRSMERRYEAESQELKRQLASKHKMSVEELELLLDQILEWKYGAADSKTE